MASLKELLEDIVVKSKEAGDAARPDATYTFTNKEASILVAGLSLVQGFATMDQERVQFMAAGIFGRESAATTAKSLADRIMAAQCPAYIKEAVNKFADGLEAERRAENQTDKSLS